jgi:PKD domain
LIDPRSNNLHSAKIFQTHIFIVGSLQAFVQLNLEKLLLLLSFSIMLLFTVYSNSAHAQLAKTVGIKITSPVRGQQIPVGIKNLQISGTASYNSTMKCQVSLIVDDVRPYQKAAAGHKGDYSSWNYTLTPQYTNIKQGMNKLTAKLSCHDNSMNLTKFYSTNITGVASSSKQASLDVSKSTSAYQTKNETGKITPLPAKQNVTTASTVLQPLPNTLTVNAILAKTGVQAAIQQQAVSQSNTSSTTVQHHHHQPTATTGKTDNLASTSVKSHSSKRHQEKTVTPSSNSTASNSTASNSTASNSTASNSTASNSTASNSTASNNSGAMGTAINSTVGKVSIPLANNSTVGKVSIPLATATVSTANSTVMTQNQHNNVTTPFFPSPSVGSATSLPSQASSFNNSHQFLQRPPIANAGPAQVVTSGSPVILNGSNSRAPTGIILSYSWVQMPTSARITLSGVNTPVWEFIAPKVDSNTLLRFQLTVTNNLGQTGTDTVNILDKTGSSSNAQTQSQITKSPSASTSIPSTNQNRGSNTVSIPPSNAAIQPPLTAPISPPLIPPVNSQLAAQANNAAQSPSHDSPVANAGQDQVVNANSTVVLVGSLSKDPDGDSISYHWMQVSGSPAITLGGANTPVWEFTAPSVPSDTTLTFQLTVTDSHGLSDRGRVNVLVKAHSAHAIVTAGHGS